MKIQGVDIRVGNLIEHKGRLWVATRIQHVQPGKGGAYMQVELKDIRDGTKLNERFRSSETVERARLDEKAYQFLYAEGEVLTLMDTGTFEQVTLDRAMVGEAGVFLQDGMMVTVTSHEGRPVGVRLPEQVALAVAEAEPVVKGQTAASSYKPAVLENGVRIMVPPHIEVGARVVVNTAERTYVERAKDQA
ncbi:MAG: elongation factor P [Kiloniellales bacterium]